MPKFRRDNSLIGGDEQKPSTSEKADGDCVGLTKSGVYVYMDPTWCERIYSTKRDSTKVRTLKRFRILPKTPKSVTYAEVGVGVNLFPDINAHINEMAAIRDKISRFSDVLEKILTRQKTTKKLLKQAETSFAVMGDHRRNLTIQLAEKEEQVQTFSQEANEYKQKWQCSYAFSKKMFEELKTLKQEMESVEVKLEEITKEKNQQAADNKNLKEMLEDLTLTDDHTCHEKELVEKDLQEAGNAIRMLKDEYWTVMDEVTSYKRMYLQTKVDASDIITHYVQQLNNSLEEKQTVLLGRLSKTSDSSLKKTLTSADEYLKLKTENNRLVDQLEFLSSKTAVQDVYIEELQDELQVKDKCLNAFEGAEPKDEGESRLMAFIKQRQEGDGFRQQQAGRAMYALTNQREREQWMDSVTQTPPGEQTKRRRVKRRDASPVSSTRETNADLPAIGKQRENHHNDSLSSSGKSKNILPIKAERENRQSRDSPAPATVGGQTSDPSLNKKGRAERHDRISSKSTPPRKIPTPKKEPENRQDRIRAESTPPRGQITDSSPSRKHRESRHRRDATNSAPSARSPSNESNERRREKKVDRPKSKTRKEPDSEHPATPTKALSDKSTPSAKSDEFTTPPGSPREELGRKLQTRKDCNPRGNQQTAIPSPMRCSNKGMARIGTDTMEMFRKQRAKATAKHNLPDHIYCAP